MLERIGELEGLHMQLVVRKVLLKHSCHDSTHKQISLLC